MKKTVSDNIGSFYQHYPRLAVVVTANAGGRDNAMSIAWHTSISKNPPLFGVCVSPNHFTYKLIAQSKQFGVNFIPDIKAELVAALGGSKGNQMDKFSTFSIDRDNAQKTAVPILEDAYAAFECRLVDDRLYGDHKLLVGEVVAVHYDEAAFMENGVLDMERVNPTLYLGGEIYLNTQECRRRTLNRSFCVDRFKK
ncbi:MAG: flavin reductase family protein [Dehalococcoidia bacterium]|nr:MAG: flavin reductase family protein [Dehalococcoidia bacterium]